MNPDDHIIESFDSLGIYALTPCIVATLQKNKATTRTNIDLIIQGAWENNYTFQQLTDALIAEIEPPVF